MKKGLYFIVPEPVYQRFEEIIGSDIPVEARAGKDIITVYTYDLGPGVRPGNTRKLVLARTVRFQLDEFSMRFITGPNLPSGETLGDKIRMLLGCE